MSKKATVTFLEDVIVLDHNDDVTFEAKAGDCKELEQASAERWVLRKKAVPGKAEKPVQEKDDKEKATKAGKAK